MKKKQPVGILQHYLALYEWMTRKVPRVSVWIGTFRFPKATAAKWPTRKARWEEEKVGTLLARWAEQLAHGERFFDVKIAGDLVSVVGWDWHDDPEGLGQSFIHALDAAAALEPKGKILNVIRFERGDCKWTSFTFKGKKVDVDEGELEWESERMQEALAAAGPPFRAWLDAHPETKVRFERSGRFGYVDREGREVIVPELARAYEFSEGIANVQDDQSARLLARDGTLLPGTYFLTDYCMRGLAPVAVEQDEYGYADRTGKLRIPARFTRAEPFRGPLAQVTLEGHEKRWIDGEGKTIGDPIEYTHGFTEDLAWVYRYDLESYGCIDATGKPAFEHRYYATAPFSGGLAAVIEKKGQTKWGYCDRTGKVVIAPKFDEAHPFSEGRAAVRIGKEHRIIDERGKLLGEAFQGIEGTMSEGRIVVRAKGKCGFADDRGKIVIAPKYEQAAGYFEGRAYVAVKQKSGPERWGHIDRDGNMVVPATLEWTNRYRDGLAPAKSNGLCGFIDLEGKWVIPPRYKATQPMFTDGLAWVQLP